MSEDENDARRSAKIKALKDWIAGTEREVPVDVVGDELSRALYSYCELGLIENIDALDVELAVKIWAVVETCRRTRFPDALRM